MLKTRIIASDVCSLTDARYFSAWGVDYLSFNCDKNHVNYVDEDSLKEIREWVEGPQIAGSFLNEDNIEEQIRSRKLDAIVLREDVSTNQTSVPVIKKHQFNNIVDVRIDGEENTTLIINIREEDLDILFELSPQKTTCYLDIEPLDISIINRVIENGKFGLVLKGSAEEKVGFKFFDFLDDVYDLLMD